MNTPIYKPVAKLIVVSILSPLIVAGTLWFFSKVNNCMPVSEAQELVNNKPLVAASEFGADIMVWEPLSSEDTMMLEDIETARRDVENDTRRAILTQTWDYHIQKWPSADRIKMPLGNLQSVTSIKWKSTDGTETTLTEGTDYLVETNGDRCGYIVLPYNGSWPSGTLYPSNPITITYVCGWTSAALVPTTIKRAIKSRAVNYYMNRGDDIVGYHMVTRDITYDRLINNVPPLWDEDFI